MRAWAALLWLAAGSAGADPPRGAPPLVPDMVSGAVTPADLREVFGALKRHCHPSAVLDDAAVRAGTPSTFEGSPAKAVSNGFAGNNSGFDKVYAAPSLLEVAQNKNQLAYFLAHELSHLAAGHSQLMKDFAMARLDQWMKTRDLDGASADRIVAAYLTDPDEVQARADHQKGLERDADADGLNCMVLPKDAEGRPLYDPAQAPESLQSAREWLKAVDRGREVDQLHEPLSQRVENLRRWNRVLGRAASPF